MNNYLIPANTNRGKLIFGFFRPIDLIILGIGVFATFMAILLIPLESTSAAVIAIAPAVICVMLVAPVPYYHNVITIIVEMIQYLTSRRKYVWKGWSWKNGE